MTDAEENWRAWLKFQLQFKQRYEFGAMERTGEGIQQVLDLLRARLYSSNDVAIVDEAVARYEQCGGSQRGRIYKALEALMHRYCPMGTRQKAEAEMNALHKHTDMTVAMYTKRFYELLEMYHFLPLHDGPTVTSGELCRLYSSGMPHEWQDLIKAEPGSVLTIGELECQYKRFEREEREADEYHLNKRRRCEGGDDRSEHCYERRVPINSCNCCREFRYGNAYKTHTDEQCYRNPKNNNRTRVPRYIPRGKCTAMFGPGTTESQTETDRTSPQPQDGEGCIPLAQDNQAPICTGDDTTTEDVKSTDSKLSKHEEELDDSGRTSTTVSVQKEESVKSKVEPCTVTVKMDPALEPTKPRDVSTPNSDLKPWENIQIAMIGPFGQTDWCVLVLVDAATQFVELCPIIHGTNEEITQAIDQEWLSRYPWPKKFIYSARVPAYDPRFSHLKNCGAYGATPLAEPAPTNMLSVLLLHLHLSIEMRVMAKKPQSHLDWINLVCIARLDMRSANVPSIAQTNSPLRSKSNQFMNNESEAEINSAVTMPVEMFSIDHEGKSLDTKREFAPEDMVYVEYHRSVGKTPRREGPYRVEAVRTNGTLVIDKGKYLEHILAQKAVLA